MTKVVDEKKLIIALDFDEKSDVLSLCNELDPKTCRVKIGKQELKENYIPDLSAAKNLGLQAKISLDMQIEDSLNYYYAKDIKSSSIYIYCSIDCE